MQIEEMSEAREEELQRVEGQVSQTSYIDHERALLYSKKRDR
jgi:hypothetical protein